jgi:acyl-CoA thioesterase FadM
MELKTVLRVDKNPNGYGHIGYEHFSFYFKKGTEELAKKMSLDILSLNKKKIGLWVKTNNLNYKFSLFNGDEIEIYSRFTDIGSTIVTMQQIMEKDKLVIATSKTEFYFINLPKIRLIRVPKDISEKLKEDAVYVEHFHKNS